MKRNINFYLFITLLLISMQTLIALRFYATDTFPVCDWRLIWRQFVADVKEKPGRGVGVGGSSHS